MPSILGKRKAGKSSVEPSISQEDVDAIFRRHFEAQFKPLDPAPRETSKSTVEQDVDSSEEEEGDDEMEEDGREEVSGSESEWSGISGDEEASTDTNAPPAVEVVEVIDITKPINPKLSSSSLSKREAKAYLSSKIPSATSSSSSSSRPTPASLRKHAKSSDPAGGEEEGEDAQDEDAPSLLKNDLALRRLLAESHLLSSAAASEPGGGGGMVGSHSGRARHLANDLRLKALGSKDSIFAQKKMPQAHRRGIVAAAAAREEKRRREARANGVVLERFGGGGGGGGGGGVGQGKSSGRGSRGGGGGRNAAIDAPAVGRMRDGMLRLSQKDVRDIQGSDGRGSMMGRKRRR